MANLVKITENEYEILWPSGSSLGFLIRDVDGYFYWEPHKKRTGLWDEGTLYMIADHLREINKIWDTEVRNLND